MQFVEEGLRRRACVSDQTTNGLNSVDCVVNKRSIPIGTLAFCKFAGWNKTMATVKDKVSYIFPDLIQVRGAKTAFKVSIK